jgi:hypothetical protein
MSWKTRQRIRSSLLLSSALGLLFGTAASVRAGILQPGDVPLSVSCGQVIQASDSASGLRLEPTDPIVAAPCDKDGIQIRNVGAGRLDRSFELDCSFLALRGKGAGTGVDLVGTNLSVSNCYVERFKNGVVGGAGSTITDSRVTDCTDDGVVLKNPQSPNAASFAPIAVNGTRSRRNGGWGFRLQGNGTGLDAGTFFRSKATGNAKGGFLIKGNGNLVAASEALGNDGPGFSVSGNENALSSVDAEGNGGGGIVMESNQCCRTNFLDAAIASGNTGPGVAFTSRANPGNGGFPAGLDTSPGSIDADANGDCQAGSLPNALGDGVCPVAKGRACSIEELEGCGIIPPPPAVCGNDTAEFPEACDGADDARCPGQCRPDCTCPRS